MFVSLSVDEKPEAAKSCQALHIQVREASISIHIKSQGSSGLPQKEEN